MSFPISLNCQLRWQQQASSRLPLLQMAFACMATGEAPNIAFKPKLHRYAVHMAEKACHVPGYALQFGLT